MSENIRKALVKYEFTHEEKAKMHQELVEKSTQIRQKGKELKTVKANYKAEIESFTERIEYLLDCLSSGYTMKLVELEKYLDYERGKVLWKHPQTWKTIFEEDMTDEDRQKKLFDDNETETEDTENEQPQMEVLENETNTEVE